MEAFPVTARYTFAKSKKSARHVRISRQREAQRQNSLFHEDPEREEKTFLAPLRKAPLSADHPEFSDDEEKVKLELELGSRRNEGAGDDNDRQFLKRAV